MKALELARQLSERAAYFEKHAEGDTMDSDAAAELRRLAAVNAELLEAIHAVTVSAVIINSGGIAVSANALMALMDVSDKATEEAK